MNKDGQSGFTLLETLVAMAILSIALVTLFRAAAGGMQGLDRTDRSATAAAIAISRLEAAGQDDATSGKVAGGYSWRVQTVPYGEPGGLHSAAGPAAHWVTVSVDWRGSPGAQPQILVLRSLAMDQMP